MIPPSSSGGSDRQTVRCADCLFWEPPAKRGEGYHCFLTLREIPRRRAAEDRACPGYVDRYDVQTWAASTLRAAGLRDGDLL